LHTFHHELINAYSTTPSTTATPAIGLALLSAEVLQTASPAACAKFDSECYNPTSLHTAVSCQVSTTASKKSWDGPASLLDKSDKGEDPPEFELKAVGVGRVLEAGEFGVGVEVAE